MISSAAAERHTACREGVALVTSSVMRNGKVVPTRVAGTVCVHGNVPYVPLVLRPFALSVLLYDCDVLSIALVWWRELPSIECALPTDRFVWPVTRSTHLIQDLFANTDRGRLTQHTAHKRTTVRHTHSVYHTVTLAHTRWYHTVY